MVFVGGGGYVPKNAAILWTRLTAMVTGSIPPEDVSEDDEHFLDYGPDYEMTIPKSRMRDENTQDDLDALLGKIDGEL